MNGLENNYYSILDEAVEYINEGGGLAGLIKKTIIKMRNRLIKILDWADKKTKDRSIKQDTFKSRLKRIIVMGKALLNELKKYDNENWIKMLNDAEKIDGIMFDLYEKLDEVEKEYESTKGFIENTNTQTNRSINDINNITNPSLRSIASDLNNISEINRRRAESLNQMTQDAMDFNRRMQSLNLYNLKN